MAILVDELASAFLVSVYPWLGASSFVFLVCAVAHKTFTSDVRPQVDPPRPVFNAAWRSLVKRLSDATSKPPVFKDELATQGVKPKAAMTERDATIAHLDAMATKSQALLMRILDLDSENKILSSKLQVNEMTIACLEAQVALKTQSQNEILDDMTQIEGELEAVKGDLDAAKATIIDLETKLCDSGMQVISLDRQLAMKTEAQTEILDEMDQLEDELKTAKVKIQETAEQKAAIERDLVELRELASWKEARNVYSDPGPATASDSSVDHSDSKPQPALNSRQWQLNTPPASPQKSLLFRSVKDSLSRRSNVSSTSSRFGLPIMRIPSRRGRVGHSPKKSFSTRDDVSSALSSSIDKP